jgi:general secretion pathway protein G
LNTSILSQRSTVLIEIMVVITILGLIAAAVGVAVIPQLNHAKVETTRGNIRTVMGALKLYYTQKGKYPDTGEGLGALVAGKQLDAAPKDAWGKELTYTLENGKPVITSYGADGNPGGQDDDADITSKDLEGK